jgi:tRNA G18 (ribose-2'-O)-methylase SpoU
VNTDRILRPVELSHRIVVRIHKIRRKDKSARDRLAGSIAAEIQRKEGFRIFATALDKRSLDIRDVDFSGKIGFVIGNEGHGVSLEAIAACDGTVIIPMREGPESLNAAVATSVVMWEAARNRL